MESTGWTVQAQLSLPADVVGQPALAAATRHWFTEGAPVLGGALWSALAKRDTAPGDVEPRWAGVAGDVWAECSVQFPWEHDWGGYTDTRWRDLLTAIDGPSIVLAFTAYELARLGDRTYPGWPRLSLTGRYVDPRTAQWWGLKAQVSAGHVDDAALLAFVRGVADAVEPGYGEISYDNAGPMDQITSLEHGLGLRPWETVRRAGRRLRGYAWLTIVGQRLGDRLGGLDGLRASGAWVEVEPLAHGGYWLLATPRLSGYGPEQAAAVQAALAPVLPPGQPRADRPGEAPHRLAGAVRNPRRRARPPADGDVFDSRIDARDSTAFQLAVALRMASLHARFPDALVWGATAHEDGAPLVCWGADRGDVWVWRVVPDNDAYAGLDILRDGEPGLAAVAEDPLSRGRRVLPGPPFADLGLPSIEGTAYPLVNGEVGIYDAAPGLQLCYCLDEHETRAADRTGAAMTTAVALKRAVAAARSRA